MKTYSTIFIALLVLAVSSCNTTKEIAPKVTNKQVQMITPVDELFGLMQGSYDSSEQAIEDSTFYDISLHMYPIWQSDTEAKYLYVEQSVSAMQDKPYRQRVYKIVDNMDGTFASYVYKLRADSLYIGKWKDLSYFDTIGKDVLEIREGCEVVLKKQTDGTYSGSTIDKNCKSTLRGASYATSKVHIAEGIVTSWDQGFNDEGEQVWGAVAGPYIFKSIKSK